MEMIDILDESGKETGEIESREIVHSKGLWHKTVHVWILNHKGEFLFQKRSMKKETHPGLWDISCAGHVASRENCT
jgi:isopentenyl-diphosphate Delta-isomerase